MTTILTCTMLSTLIAVVPPNKGDISGVRVQPDSSERSSITFANLDKNIVTVRDGQIEYKLPVVSRHDLGVLTISGPSFTGSVSHTYMIDTKNRRVFFYQAGVMSDSEFTAFLDSGKCK